jgi:hypothetical protein
MYDLPAVTSTANGDLRAICGSDIGCSKLCDALDLSAARAGFKRRRRKPVVVASALITLGVCRMRRFTLRP